MITINEAKELRRTIEQETYDFVYKWCQEHQEYFEDISATAVRALLETPNVPPTALEAVLPHYVLIYKTEIIEYLKAAI